VDLERAIETQRMALLRLLSGWIAVVGFASGGSFVLPLPRWVRGFFDTLLTRAEFAAQCLVSASACLQGGGHRRDFGESERRSFSHAKGDVPSSQTLLRRMEALRGLLENLSRYALRQIAFRHKSPPYDWKRDGWRGDDVALVSKSKWLAPQIERPPDQDGTDFLAKQDWIVRMNTTMAIPSSLPISGREAKAVV